MLDIDFIRKNQSLVKESIKNRQIKFNLDELLEVDQDYREILKEIEDLRARKNSFSQEVNKLEDKEKKAKIQEARDVADKIKKIEPKLEELKKKFDVLMYRVPNLISKDTPFGRSEKDNQVIKTVDKPRKFDFKPKNHMELGVLHNLIETEKSAKISGSRFNYLFREAVLLQFALVQFGLGALTNKKVIKELADKVGNPFDQPFVPVMVPDIVKAEVMKKMDRFDPIEDRYYLEKDNCLLIGSAEHTMGPLHMNEMINEKDLPIRYVGYSTSFRREAGSYGKDTFGIIRRHQFDKLEMETFIQEKYGQVEQDFVVAVQEYLVQKLEIPYQVVLKCTADMGGKADFRAIDIECFMPGEGKYRETHTSDYMTDYQARRLNTKYKDKDGNKKFVHMNDATCFAIGRTIIAILENYQKEDGSIEIPKVLRPYMGDLKEIKK